jgi:7,8-dihydropterin-6-yl-methyl-4-(beta-D-ribofuranosyl)aminobenzene 5'-phosphate synthase
MMIERLSITVLADNYVAAPNLLGEHGLSFLIEVDGRRILFDTGQGRVLFGNAQALGTDVSKIEGVVLSHGHFDHTGGLAELLGKCSPSAIYLHPSAMRPKYAKSGNLPHRFIGVPEPSRQALSAVRERLVWTESATEVVPGAWCTGAIPRLPANGPKESGFFLDPNCHEPDPLADDQALYIETTSGLVVIAGCAHAGIANTLDRVAELTGKNEIFGLVGGLHLWRATLQELEASGDAIGRRKLQVIAPCHCTGLGAHSYLRARFHSLVEDVGAGTRLHFGGR